jgi:hypothetical protein
MATCVVSGTLIDPSGTGIQGATIKANIVAPYLAGGTSLISPKEQSTQTNSSGVWSLTLIQGLSVIVAIEAPQNATDSNRRNTFSIIVPATSTATFENLVTEY